MESTPDPGALLACQPDFVRVLLELERLSGDRQWKEHHDQVVLLHHQVVRIAGFAAQYDSLNGEKANGFRTFVHLAGLVIKQVRNELIHGQQTLARRRRTPTANLTMWLDCVSHLCLINQLLLDLHLKHGRGDALQLPVLPWNGALNQVAHQMATYPFWQLYLPGVTGFHLTGDTRQVAIRLTFWLAVLADVHDAWQSGSLWPVLRSMLGIRYLMQPGVLAKRILAATREKQVNFCKLFYSLPEHWFIRPLISLPAGRQIRANHELHISPDPLTVARDDGSEFRVPIPTSHVGAKELSARLIAPFRAPGMVGACGCWWSCDCNQEISPSIMFHIHGGGFVAQTSRSHLTYLAQWARQLGVPIFSVDYSLAPDAPFPRAVEEVLYLYFWMRSHFSLLGTTGQRVLVGGDSAGANLSVGLVIQCVRHSLAKPDGLFLLYPSLLCQMDPSPSRLICLLDPLVMFPFLLRCLNCYADPRYRSGGTRSLLQEMEQAGHTSQDELLSPLLVSQDVCRQFPPTQLFSTNVDPCLDETVTFSNKLITAAVPVSLHVLQGVPHGFLSLNGMSTECEKAVQFVTDHLKQFFRPAA